MPQRQENAGAVFGSSTSTVWFNCLSVLWGDKGKSTALIDTNHGCSDNFKKDNFTNKITSLNCHLHFWRLLDWNAWGEFTSIQNIQTIQHHSDYPASFRSSIKGKLGLPQRIPIAGIKQFRTIQQHPELFRNIQQHPAASSSIQKHPGPSSSIQNHPVASNTIQDHPRESISIQDHQALSSTIKPHHPAAALSNTFVLASFWLSRDTNTFLLATFWHCRDINTFLLATFWHWVK